MGKNSKKHNHDYTEIEVSAEQLPALRTSYVNPEKERITLQLPKDLIERVKNAVFWTPGLTITELATEALSMAVDILEEERGGVFKRKTKDLKAGRPIKTR